MEKSAYKCSFKGLFKHLHPTFMITPKKNPTDWQSPEWISDLHTLGPFILPLIISLKVSRRC